MSWSEVLTILNSIALGILPLVFFRRQKLNEIKYKEIMDLGVKIHDITTRADNSLEKHQNLSQKDFARLDFLISRYRKHNESLSKEVRYYKYLWEETNKFGTDVPYLYREKFVNQSVVIRDMADALLK